MEKAKRKIMDSYEGKGPFVPGSWKEESDQLFNREELRKLYSALVEKGAVPEASRDFTFVSPTSNIPTHELGLFERDRETRVGHSTFMAGDISELPLDVSQIQRSVPGGIFQYFRWDAERLPIQNGAVDMIWDRKGWLWHAAALGDIDRFYKAINNYHDLLRDGGCIVIDNIPGYERMLREMNWPQRFRNIGLILLAAAGIRQLRPSEIYGGPDVLQYEESTVDNIDDLRRAYDEPIWQEILKKFEISNAGSGAGRVKILRKRPSA